MDLLELSDRLEITETLARYPLAVDSGRWDLLDTVFTPDAMLDYSAAGGTKGPLAEVKAWLAETLAAWPGRQHLLGPLVITPAGDEAEVTAPYTDTLAPSRDMVEATRRGFVRGGGWYHHRMVRTPAGWRSREVVLEQLWRTIQ